MKTTSNLTIEEVYSIITESGTGKITVSDNPEKSDLLIFPLCMTERCCFFGKHQFNILRKVTSKEIKFPYKCTDNYHREITKKSPDDIGNTDDPWSFPDFRGDLVYSPDYKDRFRVIDGGCFLVKCFLEFYDWDFKKINFSIIKNFSSSLLPAIEMLIRKAKQWGFNAIFFQDEFGYSQPWFSTDFFKRELLPFYIKIANIIHKNGLLFFLHSCGKNLEFFKILKGYVDVWHKGDWESLEEINEVVENRELPIIFVDTSETNFNIQKIETNRNYIIYIKE